jgi:hypothetical protein
LQYFLSESTWDWEKVNTRRTGSRENQSTVIDDWIDLTSSRAISARVPTPMSSVAAPFWATAS